MPQHKSAVKRVRQNEKHRARNRFHRSRMRSMLAHFKTTTNKEESEVLLREVKAYLDRMVHKRIIHKNKAANYKSALDKVQSARA